MKQEKARLRRSAKQGAELEALKERFGWNTQQLQNT